MASPFNLLALVEETEAELVRTLRLTPIVLPLELAVADGVWKGERVTARANAYRSSTIGYARFVYVDGPHLEIGNVVCLPDPGYPLPIFGADLVVAGRDQSMIAVDLSPTSPPGTARGAELVELARQRAASPELPSGGVLPTWCADWFSPYALYTRVTADQMDAAAAAYRAFPHVFSRLAQDATPAPEMRTATCAVLRGYLGAHRTDDRGLNLLRRMFGESWANRFVDEVLFPVDAIWRCSARSCGC